MKLYIKSEKLKKMTNHKSNFIVFHREKSQQQNIREEYFREREICTYSDEIEKWYSREEREIAN
jgi:uncharacterized protein YjcR